MRNYLDFERDIKVLQEEIEKLRDPFDKEGLSEVNTQKISEIEKKYSVKLNFTNDKKFVFSVKNLNKKILEQKK